MVKVSEAGRQREEQILQGRSGRGGVYERPPMMAVAELQSE